MPRQGHPSSFYWTEAPGSTQSPDDVPMEYAMQRVSPPAVHPPPSRRVRRGGFQPALSSQPFRVRLHPEVPFVLDLHAHLSSEEIIGFLAGRWDREKRVIDIQAAFPCRALITGEGSALTDVEMDPGSEMQVRDIIQRKNLQVVGWYHSHPAFQPDPSITDIQNQMSQQQMFMSEASKSSRGQGGQHPFKSLSVAAG